MVNIFILAFLLVVSWKRASGFQCKYFKNPGINLWFHLFGRGIADTKLRVTSNNMPSRFWNHRWSIICSIYSWNYDSTGQSVCKNFIIMCSLHIFLEDFYIKSHLISGSHDWFRYRNLLFILYWFRWTKTEASSFTCKHRWMPKHLHLSFWNSSS